MRRIYQDKKYEIFAAYDHTAEVYELFTEETAECYIGCADTIKEAEKIAKEYAREGWAGR